MERSDERNVGRTGLIEKRNGNTRLWKVSIGGLKVGFGLTPK